MSHFATLCGKMSVPAATHRRGDGTVAGRTRSRCEHEGSVQPTLVARNRKSRRLRSTLEAGRGLAQELRPRAATAVHGRSNYAPQASPDSSTRLGGKHHDGGGGNADSRVRQPGRSAVHDHDDRLGHRRDARRGRAGSSAGMARTQLRHPLSQLRAAPPAPHERRHLRVRRVRALRYVALRRPEDQPCAALPARLGELRLLGLAAGDSCGGGDASSGHHDQQGVRRARMADRLADRRRLGELRGRLLRHGRETAHRAYLRRELVLWGLHRDGRGAAHREQPRDSRRAVEILLGLRGDDRRDGAVVVRAQRGRLLPDRRLPRHDVLLRAEAGPAARLLVPTLRRTFLGADLGLHVGRAASSALHVACPTGCSRSGWCSR